MDTLSGGGGHSVFAIFTIACLLSRGQLLTLLHSESLSAIGLKRTIFSPWSKFFPLRVRPNSEGLCHQGSQQSQQEVAKVVSLIKTGKNMAVFPYTFIAFPVSNMKQCCISIRQCHCQSWKQGD